MNVRLVEGSESETPQPTAPAILAPAGSRASFLAALAAGADAIYCGLKSYSARMEAKNFTLGELAALTELAHAKGTRVFVAFNTLVKSEELDDAGHFWGSCSATCIRMPSSFRIWPWRSSCARPVSRAR